MATAVVLPGRRYGHDQPGLFLTELALERAGLDLVRVEWPEAGMPQEAEDAAAAVAELAAPLLDEGPAYVVAKSLGTLAAPLAAERGIPAVWLTPLLQEPLCADAVLAHPGRQLLVAGADDFAWDQDVADRAAAGGAAVEVLPGADHAFFVEGDAAGTAAALVGLVRAVIGFVA